MSLASCYRCHAISVIKLWSVCVSGVDPAGKGKKLHTEWKWVFGEMAWDIQIGSVPGQHK